MRFLAVLIFICPCLGIRPTFRILSGLETAIHKYPWMLSIRNGSGYHVCGASLIRAHPNLTRSDVALTAAHCFRSYILRPRPLNALILAGATLDTFNATTGLKRRIIEVQGSGFFPGDDAAVLKLDEPLEFTDLIQPIDLPAQGKPVPKNANCVVTGWGHYQHAPLHELPVTIQACNEKKFEYYNNFCAAGTAGSICSGDSGSPLVCQDEDGRQIQHGIVSYSDPSCGDHPATYAKVGYYVDWIQETVKKITSLIAEH